ncbi:uncharacterized protein TNIN_479681 [Trichonephila inaurata madagascariensis]|uniref:Uncharacterized protein n=1 Tax=Trichonephila inaurata madagascariensis TaxID=2747483 RepID=A0A8X6WYL4_9ARAC|nr:uncharacterized protein TNIN_479681 [Trichonephila inaurata madagascariensis]
MQEGKRIKAPALNKPRHFLYFRADTEIYVFQEEIPYPPLTSFFTSFFSSLLPFQEEDNRRTTRSSRGPLDSIQDAQRSSGCLSNRKRKISNEVHEVSSFKEPKIEDGATSDRTNSDEAINTTNYRFPVSCEPEKPLQEQAPDACRLQPLINKDFTTLYREYEEENQIVQRVVEETMDAVVREEEGDMDEDTRRIREAEAALRSLSGDFEPDTGMDIFAGVCGGVATERPFFENLFEKKNEMAPKTAEVVTNSWKDVVTLSASSSSCSSERSPLRSPILSPVVSIQSIKEERRDEQDLVTSPMYHQPPEEEYSPQGALRVQQQQQQQHPQHQQPQPQTPISSPDPSFSVPASVEAKPMSCTSQYSSADEVFDEFTPMPAVQPQEDSRSVDNVGPTVNEGEPYDVASLLKIEEECANIQSLVESDGFSMQTDAYSREPPQMHDMKPNMHDLRHLSHPQQQQPPPHPQSYCRMDDGYGGGEYFPPYGCPPASPASRRYLLLDNKLQEPVKRPMSFDDHLLPLPEDDHPLVIDEGRQQHRYGGLEDEEDSNSLQSCSQQSGSTPHYSNSCCEMMPSPHSDMGDGRRMLECQQSSPQDPSLRGEERLYNKLI